MILDYAEYCDHCGLLFPLGFLTPHFDHGSHVTLLCDECEKELFPAELPEVSDEAAA